MIDVLYQDEWLIAVDKPAGMLVHPSRIAIGAEDLMSCLRDQLSQKVYLIHRLDRPTSGVVLLALDSDTARALTQQFEARSVEKKYEAIVRGYCPKQGVWDEPLLEKLDRVTDKKASRNKPAQAAVTEFRALSGWEVPFPAGISPKYSNSRYSHVSIIPRTGRRHQIRRHFNHMSHPVIGDTTHGDRRHNRVFRDRIGVCRMLLVARSMRFQHPWNGGWVTISASVGADFEKALDRLQQSQVATHCWD